MGQDDLHSCPRRRGAHARTFRAVVLLGLLATAAVAALAADGTTSASRLATALEPRLVPGPVQLTYLRFESLEHGLCVSLPASESWRELRLQNPPRFVLDLDGVESRLPLAPAIYESRIGVGPLRAIRTGELPAAVGDHRTRLTLEFTATTPCEVRRVGGELRIEISGGFSAGFDRELRGSGWRELVPSRAAPPAVAANAGPMEPGAVVGAAPAPPERSRELVTPEVPDVLRSADRLFRAGDLRAAAAAYTKALAREPAGDDAAWALFQLGNCRWLSGESVQARGVYTRLAEEWPRSIWVPLAKDCLERR